MANFNDLIRAKAKGVTYDPARKGLATSDPVSIFSGGKLGDHPVIKKMESLIVQARQLRQQANDALVKLQSRAEQQTNREGLQNDLGSLKQQYLQAMEALKAQAFNAAFRLDNPDVVGTREAINQAQLMNNEQEAEQRFIIAKRTGDEMLVSAIALRSYQKGWRDILKSYFNSSDTTADAAWMLYEQVTQELESSAGRIRTSAYFFSSVNTGASGSQG